MNNYQQPKWTGAVAMVLLFIVFFAWYNVGVPGMGGPWVGISIFNLCGIPILFVGLVYIIFGRK